MILKICLECGYDAEPDVKKCPHCGSTKLEIIDDDDDTEENAKE